MLMPLGFVVVVSMIKDIIEDIKRHMSDNIENNRKVMVLNPDTGVFEVKLWRDIHVGQVVRIEQDEFFPADIILIQSSSPKGICFIETKNLDGETNLKHKLHLKTIECNLTFVVTSSTGPDWSSIRKKLPSAIGNITKNLRRADLNFVDASTCNTSYNISIMSEFLASNLEE